MAVGLYKRALVLGLGASGVAATKLLAADDVETTAIDMKTSVSLVDQSRDLSRLGIRTCLGEQSLPEGQFDICVTSPGISADSPWIQELEARGVPVISELELGFRASRCPLLAVTGTNGKSTLVKLCVDALAAAGLRAAPAGNYGPPLSQVVSQPAVWDWIVVEVSSFQLERVQRFCPDVAILLNIQPDHLNRHGDMKTYREMKGRVFGLPGASVQRHTVGIVLDHILEDVKAVAREDVEWVSFGTSPQADYRFENGNVLRQQRRPGRNPASYSLAGTAFDNPILGLAGAAAVAALDHCGYDGSAVVDAASAFRALPHRLQQVAVIEGVTFINDSKATNLSAFSASLSMVGGPVRLIAGGLLKEKRLDCVKEVLAKGVAAVYLIGSAAREMAAAWKDIVPIVHCGKLDQAVRAAWNDAAPGETVLLAPGCASFDQFKNFEARGLRFIEITRSIMKETEI